jgi:type IV secretion system protein VirB8
MKQEEFSVGRNGADWYADRYDAVRVERNRYFIGLVVCFGALLVSITANLLLFPLKTAVPYVIEVNKVEGTTTVVKPMDIKAIEQNQAVTLYFLYQYVYARMNYNYGLRNQQAETIRLLSASPVFKDYANQMDTSNPQSPIRLYKNNTIIHTKILSYSFPYPNIAQVHFYTELSNANGDNSTPATRRYWQATIKFTYAKNALPIEQRINVNPVGFFVTDFQLNQEVPMSEVKS